MRRIRSPRLAHFPADLEAAFVYDAAEAVAPDRHVAGEALPVHVPYLNSTDTGVFTADFTDVLKGELLLGGFGQGRVFVILIVSLLAYANQSAKRPDTEAPGVFCVQVSYCLAPTFFLIGILNLDSATLIISL